MVIRGFLKEGTMGQLPAKSAGSLGEVKEENTRPLSYRVICSGA